MAANRITMLDLAKMQQSDAAIGLIEENLQYAPEVSLFPARTIGGTSYQTLLRTGLPNVSFGKVNSGTDPTKSTFETKLVECFPLRSVIQLDKLAVSDDNPLDMALANEAAGVGEQAFRTIGRQVFYGKAADALGHPGLIDFVDSARTLNATGTTADTGSSVYFVRFGIKDVQLVFGNNTALALPPFRSETAYDAEGKPFDAWVSHLSAWAGIQCTNRNSVARIKNVTADSGKGVTDLLLSQALALFPTGYRPDAIFMTRRSRSQLQADRGSRSSLRATGAKNDQIGGGMAYAPTPQDFEGIPIIATDSLLNTEAITA